MSDLVKLKKILQDAGVKNTDDYFTQEEKDKIEDAEYLKKHGVEI